MVGAARDANTNGRLETKKTSQRFALNANRPTGTRQGQKPKKQNNAAAL